MNSLILKRFQGALLGALVGDCYGAPFERTPTIGSEEVLQKIDSMMRDEKTKLRHTDDTVMTFATCSSLIKNNGFDARQLAKEYTESYFKDSLRGYGAAVCTVFKSLRQTNYKLPFRPALDQFDGKGSYGNGAAMRCVGIALFAHQRQLNEDATLELVRNCSKITHSHKHGVNGAILLVLAVRYVLNLEEDALNEASFLEHLIANMRKIEDHEHVYSDKLQTISRVFNRLSLSGSDVNQEQIVKLLGNDVAAQNSVPLAIYSFLRGSSNFTDAHRIENDFMRTLHWAISCGGDTDTIASMACGLSGAYVGCHKISENLYKRCEGWEEAQALANKILTL